MIVEFPVTQLEISPAEKILNATKSRLKRWLLKKCLPDSSWITPPTVLGRIEAGKKIGSIKMEIY